MFAQPGLIQLRFGWFATETYGWPDMASAGLVCHDHPALYQVRMLNCFGKRGHPSEADIDAGQNGVPFVQRLLAELPGKELHNRSLVRAGALEA